MRRLALAATIVFVLGGAPARAQAPQPGDPPCPAEESIGAELGGRDLEDVYDRELTATHTIVMQLETPEDGPISEFAIDAAPATRIFQVRGPAFQLDTPGQVRVVARWQGFDDGAGRFCTATTETTLEIQPAKPMRYKGPPARDIQMNSASWRVRYGDAADLRPVQMRLRGVRRARLPGPSSPLETVTFAFRRGDRGFRYSSPPGRRIRSAGWRFQPVFGDRTDFGMEMTDYPGRGRRFGIDLEFVQAGRRLGRTRMVGRCRYLTCAYSVR
jgi:hypothetical protein